MCVHRGTFKSATRGLRMKRMKILFSLVFVSLLGHVVIEVNNKKIKIRYDDDNKYL